MDLYGIHTDRNEAILIVSSGIYMYVHLPPASPALHLPPTKLASLPPLSRLLPDVEGFQLFL